MTALVLILVAIGLAGGELTKRRPALLIRMQPGSDFSITNMRAKSSPGATVTGPHQASSIRSTPAPTA